ncbi:MAG: GNAT family N-acetyltransferase [Dehalococcoidia bacterium]
MTVYDGPALPAGPVSLVLPNEGLLRDALESADLADHETTWFDRARADHAIHYFAIERDGRLIGQIMLHDIDSAAGEGMVGYHIFLPEDRGQGSGSAALQAVCRYAFEQLDLRRLVAITTHDNAASRRIAVKARFREIGPAREGPDLVCYELRREGDDE